MRGREPITGGSEFAVLRSIRVHGGLERVLIAVAPLSPRRLPPGEFLHQFDLQLLQREEPLRLLLQEKVHFLVQVPDFQFGFEIHLVIVLARARSFASLRFWLIMITGAWMAARQDSIRFNRM